MSSVLVVQKSSWQLLRTVAGGRRQPRSHVVTPQIAPPAAAIEGRLVLGQDYSYAFQPIVDVAARSIFSYEALVRGAQGAPAATVFERVSPDNLHRFDQESRVAAIELASRLRLPCKLNLNFLPRSLYTSPMAVRSALEAAQRCGITPDRLVLEITEGEVIDDHAAFGRAVNEFRRSGLQLAIDDFGAGYAGLTMLADFQPDLLKLDMTLVRGIQRRGPRQAIVRAIMQACIDLGIDVIAEGVETPEEYRWFRNADVTLFQGYLFGRPQFEGLPALQIPIEEYNANSLCE
jgi:EAL domain-containing protein (putative c-di-GMP-specific phosphodiesterase class I)